jgi:hypothetical protein
MSGSTRMRYPREVRERAVRLVFDHEAEYPTLDACVLATCDRVQQSWAGIDCSGVDRSLGEIRGHGKAAAG